MTQLQTTEWYFVICSSLEKSKVVLNPIKMALLWAGGNAQGMSISYCTEISEPNAFTCIGIHNFLMKDYEAGYMTIPHFNYSFWPLLLPLMVPMQHVKYGWCLRLPCMHLSTTRKQNQQNKQTQTPKPHSSLEGWLLHIPIKWVWHHILSMFIDVHRHHMVILYWQFIISISCWYRTKQTQAPFMVNGELISSTPWRWGDDGSSP